MVFPYRLDENCDNAGRNTKAVERLQKADPIFGVIWSNASVTSQIAGDTVFGAVFSPYRLFKKWHKVSVSRLHRAYKAN